MYLICYHSYFDQEKGSQFFFDQKALDSPRQQGGGAGRGGKRQHHRDGSQGPPEKRKPRESDSPIVRSITLGPAYTESGCNEHPVILSKYYFCTRLQKTVSFASLI